MHGGSSDRSSASALSIADVAAAISALQSELLGVKTQMRESEAQNASLRETIVELTHENQLLKRRLFGNKRKTDRASLRGSARRISIAPHSLVRRGSVRCRGLDQLQGAPEGPGALSAATCA